MKTKMMAALSLFCVLFCLAVNRLAAQDSELDSENMIPSMFAIDDLLLSASRNPYMEGYFSETMNSMVTRTAILRMPGVWQTDISACGQFSGYEADQQDPSNHIEISQFIQFWGGMIPLPENISLFPQSWGIDRVSFPFYVGYDISGSESEEDEHGIIGVIAGSGIAAYSHRYGAVAACLAYGYNSADAEHPHKLQWGIFPYVNAKELPILHYFISLIDGYLRMDRDIFQASYRANVLFKDFALGSTHWSLSVFTESKWFNVDTKNRNSAAKLGLLVPVKVKDIPVDIFLNAIMGYREFFDTEWNRGFYESGGYMKIAAGYYLGFVGSMEAALSLTFESGVKPFLEGCLVGLVFGVSGIEEKIGIKVNGGTKVGKHGADVGFSAYSYFDIK